MRSILIGALLCAPLLATVAATVGVNVGLTCVAVATVSTLTACSPAAQITNLNPLSPNDTGVIVAGESIVRLITSTNAGAGTITLATAPAVSGSLNIQKVVDSIDHGAMRVYLTCADTGNPTGDWVSVTYGLSSGVYSPRTYQSSGARTNLAVIDVAGITPSTTYYLQGQCSPTGGTGSGQALTSEFIVTTAALSGTHPVLPTPANTWVPPAIDTGGYTTFPVPAFADGTITGSITNGTAALTVSNGTNFLPNHWIRIAGASCNLLMFPPLPDCQIQSVSGNSITLTSNVSGTATNAAVTWSIYTVSDFLYPTHAYHVPYGTIFQWAQGYRPIWYAQNNGNGSNGIELGQFPAPSWNSGGGRVPCAADPCALNDPNHPRILFRTALTPGFIPPEGWRAQPLTAANSTSVNLGGLILNSAGTNPGELFVLDENSSSTNPAHHFGIGPLVLSYNESNLDVGTDPQPAQALIGINAATVQVPPQYDYVDGVVIEPPVSPLVRALDGIIIGGSNLAVMNSYSETSYWRPAQPLVNQCSVGATTLTVAQEQWKANNADNSFNMPGNAVYTFTGSGGYSGVAWVALKSDGTLDAFYTNAATGGGSISVACAGAACGTLTASTNTDASQHAAVWLDTEVPVCSASIANSTPSSLANFVDSLWASEGSHAVAFSDGPGPLSVINTYHEGYGIGFFQDIGSPGALGSPKDVLFQHNTLYWNRSHLNGSGTWNGYNYRVRNLWETKQGRRWLVTGNSFQGEWANINVGYHFLLSGRFSNGGCATFHSENQEGISDIDYVGNYADTVSAGLYIQGSNGGNPAANCTGSGTWNAGDPPATSRVHVHHNIWNVLDSANYSPPSSNIGGWLAVLFNPVDVEADYNSTWGIGNAPLAPAFAVVDNFAGEGIDMRSNLVPVNIGSTALGAMWGDSTPQVSGYAQVPGLDQTNFSTLWTTAFPRYGGTASATMENNVVTLGKNGVADFSGSDVTAYGASGGSFFNALAPGNTFVTGNTQAARIAASGWPNMATGDFNCIATTQNGCEAGANVQFVEAALGIVSHISVVAGPTALQFSYQAPDAQVYYVRTSPDGVNWTLTTDAGGNGARVTTATGLSASTAYQWQIMAHYDQTASWFSFPSEHSSMVTSGTISTIASGTRTAQVAFPGIPVSGKVVATATPISGSGAVSETCTSSPCAFPSLSVGPFNLVWTYETSGGTPVAPQGSALMQ